MIRHARKPFGVPAHVRAARRLIVDESGCLVYSGCLKHGYGNIKGKGPDGRWMNLYVHRVAWELYFGPIPGDLCIDHLCRNRACCRIDHLELVTPAENTRRGESPSAVAARTDLCQSGLHELAGENVYVTSQGNRACKACMAAKIRERRAIINENRRRRRAEQRERQDAA